MIKADVDGGLLQPGNKEAVRQFCGLAAEHLKEIAHLNKAAGGHDDIVEHVLSVLTRIGGGESPDEAFGWVRSRKLGRAPGNHALRDWNIRMTVRDRMRTGESRASACWAVCSESGGEFLLGFELIKRICRRLKADSDLPMPKDIFPIDPTRYRAGQKPPFSPGSKGKLTASRNVSRAHDTLSRLP